jgi:hypothetical protein
MSTQSTADTRMRTIHYFYYTEYESLTKLRFDFSQPKKSSKTYIATMRHPIYFTLPKSELVEIYECKYTGQNRLKYVVNGRKYGDLLRFFDNLDSHCIELSYAHSQEWFRREFTREKLVDQYYNIYGRDLEENNELIFEATIENDKLLDKLIDYNRSPLMNLMVCIRGIEFFKDKFQWYITLEKLVYIPDDKGTRRDEPRKPTSIPVQNKPSFIDLDEDDVEDDDDNYDSDDDGDDNEDDDDYGEDDDDKYSRNDNENSHVHITKDMDSNKKDTPTPKEDIQKLIRQYSEESKRLFLNAERSRKASDMFFQRATYLQNQVRKYEEQLRSRNE